MWQKQHRLVVVCPFGKVAVAVVHLAVRRAGYASFMVFFYLILRCLKWVLLSNITARVLDSINVFIFHEYVYRSMEVLTRPASLLRAALLEHASRNGCSSPRTRFLSLKREDPPHSIKALPAFLGLRAIRKDLLHATEDVPGRMQTIRTSAISHTCLSVCMQNCTLLAATIAKMTASIYS